MVTRLLLFLVLSVFLLASCAVGPNYSRPTIDIPAQYKEATQGWKIAQPNDQHSRGAWWEIFNDRYLNQLVTRATLANQQIASSAAAYQQAQTLTAQARAEALPNAHLTGSARQVGGSSSFRSNVPGNEEPGNRAARSTSYLASLEASWEPDLWHRIRRNIDAQNASAQSAAAELANAQLSIQAKLVQNYFELRALDRQQKLIDNTVAAYQKMLNIAQYQYQQGTAARTDVIQAQTQLQLAQSEAFENQLRRSLLEHAIATLTGEAASTFSLPATSLHTTLPTIPVQLPSALLERRPDIASKERQMAAANEKIGIEMAGFFPKLTLSASGGVGSALFSEWLSAPAQVWSLGPQIVAMLFDGGLQRARTQAARYFYEQNVADYKQTVLTAFQEVEDQLATLHLLASKANTQQQAVASAQQALTLITNQYKAGTVPYLNVMMAQTVALSAQRNLTEIEKRRMVATVELIKALGGGWTLNR